jgi:predicted dehydrogenase
MLNTQIPAERRPEMVEFKGGILFELGCHLIDPAVRLLGRPDKVTSHLKKHGNFADDMIDNAMAVLEYPKAMVMISSSSLQPAAGLHRSFEILGSQGTIRVNPIEPPELQVNLTKAVGPYKKGMQTVTLPEYKRYVAEFAELANAIREKKPLSTTPEEERLVHETLLRACDMI